MDDNSYSCAFSVLYMHVFVHVAHACMFAHLRAMFAHLRAMFAHLRAMFAHLCAIQQSDGCVLNSDTHRV
jgi:hypothetical protein